MCRVIKLTGLVIVTPLLAVALGAVGAMFGALLACYGCARWGLDLIRGR